jgi:lysine-N-methylase
MTAENDPALVTGIRMPLPIRHLPVLQNWDCHQGGECCKEYQVTVTDEERARILAQGWDRQKDLGGLEPFVRVGRLGARRYVLNHREDGSCVFLSEQGRCRIHERFGYQTKPLPCRIFPFVLVPAGDHWRVGLRFACPSAAANKGRALPAHNAALQEFATGLAEREGLQPRPDGSLTEPPRLDGGRRLDWPDLLRVVDALLALLGNRHDPVERRLRKCLTLAAEVRKAQLNAITGSQLGELLDILQGLADAETPAAKSLPPPGWVGRILFRQAVALYARKDRGPNRGQPQQQGRLALLGAAWRFARGTGPVPRLHQALPATTFAQAEEPRGPLSPEAEQILERYYTIKVGSLQFCGGGTNLRLSFWEGFEALALTYPVLMWVARMYRDRSREEALLQALSIVDDSFGFNRILTTLRQRLSFQILARSGELTRLIAWYSR